MRGSLHDRGGIARLDHLDTHPSSNAATARGVDAGSLRRSDDAVIRRNRHRYAAISPLTRPLASASSCRFPGQRSLCFKACA